jgi:EpsI family protein
VLRRDLLIGSACLAGAGAAFALTPRRELSRLGAATLDQVAPATVPGWTWRDVTGLAPPSAGDDLVSTLYDQVLERVYVSPTGEEVMALLAHGPRQTNELQLHRPEVCYPAFGYRLSDDRPLTVALAAGATLPGRQFVAEGPDRRESVVYWTRIGDDLPTDGESQHSARLKSALEGFVCDGVLARFSTANLDPALSFALSLQLIPQFLAAVAPARLPALVGRDLAAAMGRAGR